MGTIRQLNSGSYQLAISLGFNKYGKRIRKYKTVRTDLKTAQLILVQFEKTYKNRKIKIENKGSKKLNEELDKLCEKCYTCSCNTCKALELAYNLV